MMWCMHGMRYVLWAARSFIASRVIHSTKDTSASSPESSSCSTGKSCALKPGSRNTASETMHPCTTGPNSTFIADLNLARETLARSIQSNNRRTQLRKSAERCFGSVCRLQCSVGMAKGVSKSVTKRWLKECEEHFAKTNKNQQQKPSRDRALLVVLPPFLKTLARAHPI